MNKNNNLLTLSYVYLLLAQLMVGICIVSSKELVKILSPEIILALRFSIAFIFLLLFHFLFTKEKIHVLKKLTPIDWFYIIAQALCAGALFNILLLWGLTLTSANVAGLVTSLLPAVIAAFAVIILKERLNVSSLLCMLFAVLGLLAINYSSFSMANSHYLWGSIIILLSLIPEAFYYILTRLHHNKLPVFLVAALMNGINIPLFWFWVGLKHNAMNPSLFAKSVSLLLLVSVGSALFYVFWFLGCKKIKASAAGLTTAFMPVATLLMAWVFLQETLSLSQFLGMVLVILSISFNALTPRKE